MAGHTLTKTIEFTSSATGCFLWLQNQEDITKVLNNSSTTTIYNPNINNVVTINNPSGTLGSDIVDSFTANRIQLANSALHITNSIKSTSASAKIRWQSRNAAKLCRCYKIADRQPTESRIIINRLPRKYYTVGRGFNHSLSKAGAIVDADYLNPVNGLIGLDTTNKALYARIGGTQTVIGASRRQWWNS